MDKIEEVKRKKEFSKLLDSIVKKALEICKGDVKETRAFLRKYFGVFLTNRVLKGKISPKEILLAHKSSQKRDYKIFYNKLHEVIGEVKSIIDLGAGVNGYSYNDLKEVFGQVYYLAIEGTGQLVDNLNSHFKDRGIEGAHALQEDLFNVEKITKLLKQLKEESPRVVFLFQVIDALEGLENNYSKKLLLELIKECEFIAISLPLESLGAKKKFMVNRKWLTDFLSQNFKIVADYSIFGEGVLIIRAKQ
jgi:hypothetical protein